jgi:hypothetical protein
VSSSPLLIHVFNNETKMLGGRSGLEIREKNIRELYEG